MTPEAGTVCKFEFISKFGALDGIYVVRSIVTFSTALASGVDFVSNLYTPAGLTATDFAADNAGYLSDRVVILESVIDSSIVYYAPESIFGKVPDPTIREYYPFILAVDLGVQKDTQSLLPLISQVTDLAKSILGVSDPVSVMTNSNNKVYLTEAEYEVLVAARAANIQAIAPLTVQLHQEQQKNVRLMAKIAEYEALLAQIAS